MKTILREWRGVIRKADRDVYVGYIKDTGLEDYRATPGNRGAAIAVRDLDAERTEVITLSWWVSADAFSRRLNVASNRANAGTWM